MSKPPPVHPGIPKREPDTSPERLADIVRRHREEKVYYTEAHNAVADLLAMLWLINITIEAARPRLWTKGVAFEVAMNWLWQINEKLEALDAGSDGGGGIEQAT